MAIQQFSAYDLIVDVLPGSVLLLGLLLLAPEEVVLTLLNSTAALGVLIVALGYVAGRVIHTIGVGSDDRLLVERSSVPVSVRHAVKYELANHLTLDDDSLFDEEEEEEEIHISTLEQSQHETPLVTYGQMVLYPENTLYGKYEALTTFFRSLFYTALMLGILFFARGVGSFFLSSLDIQLVPYTPFIPWEIYIALGVVILVLSAIFYRGWQTFDERRSDAFIYDLHRILELEELSEIRWEKGATEEQS